MGESWWRGLFAGCCDGLAYMHGKSLMHCDIKEPNIMIAQNDDYRRPKTVLIDFGLSTNFCSGTGGACGTSGYIPPETIQTGDWYPKGDVFSMGIVFFQLMVGSVPTNDSNDIGIWGPAQEDEDIER